MIEGQQVSPNPFAPNGEPENRPTTTLRFEPLGSPGAMLGVQVVLRRLPDSTLVGTLVDSTFASGDTVRTTLPSVSIPKESIPDGEYDLKITVTEGAASKSATVGLIADSEAPSVSGLNVSSPFDPGQAAPNDSLDIRFTIATDSLTDTATRAFVRLGGADVDTVGPVDGAGVFDLTWDGRFDGGAIRPFGNYEILVRTEDEAGNDDSVNAFFVLDPDPPRFALGFLDTTGTTSFPDTISGSVTDDHQIKYLSASLDDSSVANGFTVVIDSCPQGDCPPDSIAFDVIVDNAAPSPGYVSVILTTGDEVGHVVERVRVIAFDTFQPSHVASVILGDDTVRAGDTVRIRTQWEREGLEVSADFSRLDSGYVADEPGVSPGLVHDETVTEEGGGFYLIEYDITVTNSRAAVRQEVTITASTGILESEAIVTFTLEDRLLGEQLVSIDRNRFDPSAGEQVTIAAEFASLALAVDVFDLSGRRVRSLAGDGFVTWDGTNEDGFAVGTGVYFLKVEVDGAEEVRKVAVVRGRGS